MFRATMCPSSGENCIYATLGTCYSVWMILVCWVEWNGMEWNTHTQHLNDQWWADHVRFHERWKWVLSIICDIYVNKFVSWEWNKLVKKRGESVPFLATNAFNRKRRYGSFFSAQDARWVKQLRMYRAISDRLNDSRQTTEPWQKTSRCVTVT